MRGKASGVLLFTPLAIGLFALVFGKPKTTVESADKADKADKATKEQAPVARVIKWFESHPWVVATTVTTLVLTKVVFIAHGDLGTATLILEHGGAAGVGGGAASMLLTALPFMFAAAFVCSLFTLVSLLREEQGRKVWKSATAAVVATLIGCLVFIPWGSVASLAVVAAGFSFILRGKEKLGQYGWFAVVWFVCGGAILGILAALLVGPMWMPAERISPPGERPFVGYVLSDDGSRALVLVERDRTTEAYPSEEIRERERCQLSNFWDDFSYFGDPGSRILWLANPPAYESCPER